MRTRSTLTSLSVKILPLHPQITTQLRERILKGEFLPGTVLPSMHDLARQFNTSYFTVQTALQPLVEEGLIESKRRVGTVVRYNSSILTCAGIYCAGMLDSAEYDFYRALLRQLKMQLATLNVRTEIFMDSRPHNDHALPLPALVRAAEQHEVQALIVVLTDEYTLNWFPSLPVVASFAAGVGRLNQVSYDPADLLRLGLQRLRALGCRSVGLISTINKKSAGKDRGRDNIPFYQYFAAVSAELGLKTREAWIGAPEQYSTNKEREGYDQFHAVWRQASHPDGILVYPDLAARGVMTAALELGVRVPEELKLVFHHNTDVDWTCPLQVDWVESDTAAWAAAVIEQVRQQKAGRSVIPITLPYRLVPAGER